MKIKKLILIQKESSVNEDNNKIVSKSMKRIN
jgi:hypothetical protein